MIKHKYQARLLPALLAVLLLAASSGIPSSWIGAGPIAWAEPSGDAAPGTDQQLLEKSLTILELDQELARVGSQKDSLQLELDQADAKLREGEQQLKTRKLRAGVALRNYYTGRQDLLLTAIFSVKSLGDLFRVLDFMDMMMAGDRQAIADYKAKSAELQAGYSKLEQQQKSLDELQRNLLLQKARALRLQSELQKGIDESSDPAAVREQIDQLGELWDKSGRTQVQTSFRALSKAMNKLPAWLGDHPEYVKLESSGYTLRLPDNVMNSFLREQDSSLEGFTFTFDEGKVIAEGHDDSMSVRAVGSYIVVDKPKNGIKFQMDELMFNGYRLPEETMNQLLQTFDLGFYPGKFISFLKVSTVEVQDHQLVIHFSFSF